MPNARNPTGREPARNRRPRTSSPESPFYDKGTFTDRPGDRYPEPVRRLGLRIDRQLALDRRIRSRFAKAWSRCGTQTTPKGGFFQAMPLPLPDRELTPDEKLLVVGVIRDAVCDSRPLFTFDALPACVRETFSVEIIQRVYLGRVEQLSSEAIARIVEYANDVFELTAGKKITPESIGCEPRQRDEQTSEYKYTTANGRSAATNADSTGGAKPRNQAMTQGELQVWSALEGRENSAAADAQAIRDALIKAIKESPEGKKTKSNIILKHAKVSRNKGLAALRKLEDEGLYQFMKAKPARYRKST